MDKLFSTVCKLPKNQITLILMLGVGVATLAYYLYESITEQEENAQQQQYGGAGCTENISDFNFPSSSGSGTRSRVQSVGSVSSTSSRERWCAFCLLDMSSGSGRIRKLECGHEFHEICINRWLQNPDTRTCPICRRKIKI